jgi:hypothetical protein
MTVPQAWAILKPIIQREQRTGFERGSRATTRVTASLLKGAESASLTASGQSASTASARAASAPAGSQGEDALSIVRAELRGRNPASLPVTAVPKL